MTETTPSMRSKWLGCQACAGLPWALPTSARCAVGGRGGAEGSSGLFAPLPSLGLSSLLQACG